MEERKSKTRIRRKNGGIKKLLFLLILLFIIIYMLVKVIVPGSVILARYVYKSIRNYYLPTKEFYFTSDKLSPNTAHFESDNWSGVEEYRVTVNMNSRKNINEVSKVDINYNIKYEYDVYKNDGTKYSDDVIDFYITGSENLNQGDTLSRTIFQSSNNQDSFEFSVKPKTNANLQNNDYVYVKITATSTSPYVAELVGEFNIKIGTLGMSYKIEDKEYDPYCEVIVTNTLDYYIADEAVGEFQAGASIPISEYLELTEAEKEKCHSMIITLAFDSSVLRLDTTAGVYIDADKTNDIEYEIVGTDPGFEYVKQIQFKMGAEESKVIKFYKVTASENYTYPNIAGTDPVVDVSYT